MEALQDTSEWARSTLKTLHQVSPTALIVTWELWRRSRTMSLSLVDQLRLEFFVSQQCMKPQSDFHEGVRAALLDKTHPPQWRNNKGIPTTLSQLMAQDENALNEQIQQVICQYFGDDNDDKKTNALQHEWNADESPFYELWANQE